MTPDDFRLAGATIAGKYRVESVLGHGAMGVVCEARHVELGKRFAIKLIESSLADDREVVARFRREARAASLIESEHVVQVFDVGTDPELGFFMVMELLVGEDLHSRLERETMLDVATSARIAYQIARALAKAHAAGVVHRDLKPANIFLVDREDGGVFVKVLDFGISKILERAKMEKSGALKLTRAGTSVGTPQYSSPEQLKGLDSVDHRTDVWSLGVLLYELLAGRPAYLEMPTYEQFIIQLVTTSPTPIREVAPWVPLALANVVEGAIQHDVDVRTKDAATFAKLLLAAVPTALNDSGARPVVPWTRPRADDTVQMEAGGRVSLPDLVGPESADRDSKTRVDASPPTLDATQFPPESASEYPTLPRLPGGDDALVGGMTSDAPPSMAVRARPRSPWTIALYVLLALAALGAVLVELRARMLARP
jgi:serine/threonine protein kinase